MDENEYLKCPCKECGTNIEYPPDAAGTTVSCPNCGQWTELAAAKREEEEEAPGMTINLFWVLAGVVVLLGIGGAAFMHLHGQRAGADIDAKIATPAKPTNALVMITNPPANVVTQAVALPPPPPKPKSHDDLRVSEIKLEKMPNSSLVNAIGTVTNDSTYERFGVKVELDLFDAQQKNIGAAQDYKEILEPHQAWEFHALIPEKKAATAKLKAVTEQD
jgi:hypothetical protein